MWMSLMSADRERCNKKKQCISNNNLLAVCNYVAKKLHNQNFIYEAAENNIKFKMPHLSCITRWDSELQMVFIRTKNLI